MGAGLWGEAGTGSDAGAEAAGGGSEQGRPAGGCLLSRAWRPQGRSVTLGLCSTPAPHCRFPLSPCNENTHSELPSGPEPPRNYSVTM